jgi:hypothetical protein
LIPFQNELISIIEIRGLWLIKIINYAFAIKNALDIRKELFLCKVAISPLLIKSNMHNVLQSIAIGDGSKVLMLVLVSPCEKDVGETICSLSFAKRARAIESNREMPDVCFSNFFYSVGIFVSVFV